MTMIAPDLMNRARQEYIEMPGLVLTIRQASRLWNLDAVLCHELIAALVSEEFLSETRGGAFLRRDSGGGAKRN